jgi:O-succinylbenzoate synthase
LFVDANAAYSLDDVDTFRQLDEFKLMMFEQPLATNALEDSAELQHRVTTPICLDESLESVAMLERAVALGSFRIANIKIQRVGGLLPAMRLYEACEQRGIPCWMGTMPELGIGCAQAAAMASLPNCRFPTDVEASLRWFQDDIIDPLLEVRGGMIALNGWKLDDRKLRQYTVAERSWRAQ